MITSTNRNALALARNFSPVNAVVTRRAPVSPMVVNSIVQPLIETISSLGEKVDALAMREIEHSQIVRVATSPTKAKPVESKVSDIADDSPQQETRIKRSSLLDFFD